MNSQEKNELDRHITGNYGEDQLSHEESGRPPIDADLADHRRWFNEKLEEYANACCSARVSQEIENKLHDELVEAYMDGNKAERMTLTFKSNEFDVRDDGDFTVCINEGINKLARENPVYTLYVNHGTKRVLALRGLSFRAFDIDTRTIRNINQEGP